MKNAHRKPMKRSSKLKRATLKSLEAVGAQLVPGMGLLG